MVSTTEMKLVFEHDSLDGSDLLDLVGKVITAAEAAGYTTRTTTRTTTLTEKVDAT